MLMLMQTITHIKEIITLPGPDTVVEAKRTRCLKDEQEITNKDVTRPDRQYHVKRKKK